MTRYTIIDKDPLSVSIDGYVRLEDPDTGANVATDLLFDKGVRA